MALMGGFRRILGLEWIGLHGSWVSLHHPPSHHHPPSLLQCADSSLPGGNPPDVDSSIVCHAHRHHHAMWEARSELHSGAKR